MYEHVARPPRCAGSSATVPPCPRLPLRTSRPCTGPQHSGPALAAGLREWMASCGLAPSLEAGSHACPRSHVPSVEADFPGACAPPRWQTGRKSVRGPGLLSCPVQAGPSPPWPQASAGPPAEQAAEWVACLSLLAPAWPGTHIPSYHGVSGRKTAQRAWKWQWRLPPCLSGSGGLGACPWSP